MNKAPAGLRSRKAAAAAAGDPTAAQSSAPPAPAEAVRVQQSAADAILTRPFMLRQPEAGPVQLSAGAQAVADARSNHSGAQQDAAEHAGSKRAASAKAARSDSSSSQLERVRHGLLSLGLEQLPDMQALSVPVRVELAQQPDALQSDAHAAMLLRTPDAEPAEA